VIAEVLGDIEELVTEGISKRCAGCIVQRRKVSMGNARLRKETHPRLGSQGEFREKEDEPQRS
jgi:hypothetical protein